MTQFASYYLVKLLSPDEASGAVVQRYSVKKVFLRISKNSQKNTCARVQACNFIKKETLTQVLSCEVSEIFQNTYIFLQNTAGGCFQTKLLSFDWNIFSFSYLMKVAICKFAFEEIKIAETSSRRWYKKYVLGFIDQ